MTVLVLAPSICLFMAVSNKAIFETHDMSFACSGLVPTGLPDIESG